MGLKYHESKQGTKRLVIQNDIIIGYQYRNHKGASWKDTTKFDGFAALQNAYLEREGKTYSVKQSSGGNQSIVIQDNKVVCYLYRANKTTDWNVADSRGFQRFADLEKHFLQPNRLNSAPSRSYANTSNFPPQPPKPSSYEEEKKAQVVKYYKHAVASNEDGRSHLFSAESTQFFREYKGDYLKTRILARLKGQLEECLEECQNLQEFEKEVEKIRKSPDFKILATAQGLTTKIFGALGLTTSSVDAFNKMEKDLKSKFLSSQTPSPPG